MTAKAGQDAVFKIGATPVAGVRVTGFTRDATPIDITDKDSAAYQELLAGKVSAAKLSMKVEGVEKGGTLRGIALGDPTGWTITDASLDFGGGETLACALFLESYEEGQDYKEAGTFTASLTSSGQWTHTPAV